MPVNSCVLGTPVNFVSWPLGLLQKNMLYAKCKRGGTNVRAEIKAELSYHSEFGISCNNGFLFLHCLRNTHLHNFHLATLASIKSTAGIFPNVTCICWPVSFHSASQNMLILCSPLAGSWNEQLNPLSFSYLSLLQAKYFHQPLLTCPVPLLPIFMALCWANSSLFLWRDTKLVDQLDKLDSSVQCHHPWRKYQGAH